MNVDRFYDFLRKAIGVNEPPRRAVCFVPMQTLVEQTESGSVSNGAAVVSRGKLANSPSDSGIVSPSMRPMTCKSLVMNDSDYRGEVGSSIDKELYRHTMAESTVIMSTHESSQK